MKKAIFLGIFAIAAIGFWSCSKDVPTKDGAQMAKEALEKMKEQPPVDTLNVELIDTTWVFADITLPTKKPDFKQIVAAICAERPQSMAYYQLLRYLSDEKGFDGKKDNFVITDKSEDEYIRCANFTNEIERADSNARAVTIHTWKYDKGGRLIGVLYEKSNDKTILFYQFQDGSLIPNAQLAAVVNRDRDLARRSEFYEVVFPIQGTSIEYIKHKEGAEEILTDRWDGSTFKYVATPTKRQKN